jgi:DNA polymerase III subunit beta
MTSEKANSVKLAFGKNNLAITANSPEVGEARETLAVNYKGKEMAIAFNPRYLIDALAALTEDEVFFELIDELSPGVLKINGPFLYVVMPMRLSFRIASGRENSPKELPPRASIASSAPR